MHKLIYFTDDSSLNEIWNYFPLHQGDLFHYTTEKSALSIETTNELFLTRCDHFLDKSEIQYGIVILNQVAKTILSEDERIQLEKFTSKVEQLRGNLYAICFTQLENSEKHKEIYGASILKFTETFTTYTLAGSGRHSVQETEDSWRLYYACEIYQSMEGFVIYEPTQQEKLAKLIILKFQEYLLNGANVVNERHLDEILLKFILLTKHPCFAWEKEFRFGFYTVHEYNSLFEEKNEVGKIFIKVKYPPNRN